MTRRWVLTMLLAAIAGCGVEETSGATGTSTGSASAPARTSTGAVSSRTAPVGTASASTGARGGPPPFENKDHGMVFCGTTKGQRRPRRPGTFCSVQHRLSPFVIRELQKNDYLSTATLVLDADAATPESMAHLDELSGAVSALELTTAENAEVDLSPLLKLSSLKVLRITFGPGYHFRSGGDLAVLSRLAGLTHLSVTGVTLPSLELASPTLEELRVEGSVGSLDGLEGHAALRRLQLSSLSEQSATQLEKVASLKDLQSLELVLEGPTCELEPLTKLRQLTSLSIVAKNCSRRGDASLFVRLPKLEKLRIEGLKLPTVAPLARIPRLTSLHLSSTDALKELGALAMASKLRALAIEEASSFDLSLLAPLSQLERLELYADMLPSKIDALRKLIHLKQLGLYFDGSAPIDDLPFIRSMSGLQEVSIQWAGRSDEWSLRDVRNRHRGVRFVWTLHDLHSTAALRGAQSSGKP